MRNPEKKRHERKRLDQPEDFLLENFERAKEERGEIICTSLELLETGDEDARWMAVGVLAEAGDERIVRPLIDVLLSDRSPRVRAEAARALGDWRDMEKPFAALVDAATGDPSELVRDKAFEALQGITVLRKEPGKYESTDSGFSVHVEKTDNQAMTRLVFFIRKDTEMEELRHRVFVLLGPDGYIEGRTDSRGCTLIDNESLRKAGCSDGDGKLRFVLK